MINRLKALVVDDDNDTLDTIAIVLDSAGFEIVESDSGALCLDLLRSYRPDILILDLMLDTFMEGIDIYHEIRGDPAFGDIPVILISAIDKEIGFPFALSAESGDIFIEKPLTPSHLLTCINHMFMSSNGT